MPHESRISGIAAYRPSRLVTNEEVSARTTVEPSWIVERTGIRTRGHAGPEEDLVTMAAEAGRKAIAMSSADPADIGLVVLATATRKQRMPGIAPQVASRIGLPASGAFDLNAVCAGFTYAVAMGSNAVRSGETTHALVIGVERVSDWINPADPDTFVIFGDGAGAVVVSRSPEWGVGPSIWGSDGDRHAVLELAEAEDGREYVGMNGPLVYKWSTSAMPEAAQRACVAAGVTLADIRWFVPHQANCRIIDTLSRRLGFAEDQVVRDVVDAGNTSAASVPLALSRLYESGRTTPGDLVLLLGFGAGLTYSGQVVRMP
ncbi:ketoacyl-ACP synthase III [Kineosporia sp. J2-2]|uniref:Ketoacyl-ACP synthase III n=1 Tax=Kineosporia corallincola TaxID=2835133 RepID=A0ABS5TG84_9ACTN|nr:beta-ketoacyl-ACP synthase III [Kineosporia corallincola]MBT0770105.1 ketoacyl-ACP synthase III [Kineosporia corallincola]